MSGAAEARIPAQPTVVRYRIDPARSQFTVKAFASGLLSAIGHNPTIAIREFSGEASFVPGTLDQASIRIGVRPESFEVTDDVSQKDKLEIETKMKQEVLETSRYADISFESTRASATKIGDDRYAVKIAGNLTLHGFTRSLTLVAQVSLTGEILRASGEFSLRQTDYGIKLVSIAGGTLKIKDELKLGFDIVSRKQA